ncbi:hypothetical protein SOVF_060170 [Spinacia oleracea]|uniref:Pentatricopeptide repeat-containing protein At5g48910 n=1 Tax=Spinacia oleracea TaxID=3562 RepID=A0A9R0JJM5_SPIOL|nr:pentatricopeptide repeat-containing protein At5g48910 [Spinacia oleracea]XP_056684392.1 pentatricopeptide repeat-containing protein At5g48910 [Spinacia oleracea]KNA19621.1 hypothetical protein SOVF_060170 [Spinacia oleracea]
MNITTFKPPVHLTLTSTPNFPEISNCKTIKQFRQIHGKLIKTSQIHDPLMSAELVRCSAFSLRDLDYARLLFYRMNQPNPFSYNTIIRAISEDEDDPVEVLSIFTLMLCDEFLSPNKFTYPSVLKACAKLRDLVVGKQVHAQLVKLGLEDDEFVVSNLLRMYVLCGIMDDAQLLFFQRTLHDNRTVNRDGFLGMDGVSKRRQEGDVVLWNVMVDGYIKLGDMRAARQLFDKMPKRSVVSWNGMIAGYAQRGWFSDAIGVFREMQMVDENVKPNYVTLVSILPAISHLGALELGKWIHLYADRNGFNIDDVLGSALIDMYSKCGSVDKALQIFETLPKQSTITWNAVINGLAIHGRATESIQYFTEMLEMGIKPSDVTYIGVLTACSHGGKVNEGKRFFNHMIKVAGLNPRIEHYGCMVDLLGRNGLLKEAEKFIRDMNMKPDAVIWKALLGACKLHNDIEMGRRVAKHLMEMAPSDSGSYIALSNMYASLGEWDEVARIRLLMKDRDVRKDPGCSWIELDGVIHEFLVEDDSHPCAKEIHLMLKEVSDKLQSIGHQPNTTQVLLNVDEEAKESALYYHSEKIAVAFGLISTKAQTPLQVVKNLRICEDCHSSMKLISKLYNRRIVVRDRKRFHHFEDGLCSCNDFW